MSSIDNAYYQKRANSERKAALNTDDPKIALVHEDFARRYDAVVAGERPPGKLQAVYDQ